MTSLQELPAGTGLFDGPGEARALCRGTDWAATPMGPVDSWPSSLRVAAKLCLDSLSPMAVLLGTDLLLLYNEAYIPILGPIRHPSAFARPFRLVWHEVWSDLVAEFDGLLHERIATRHEDTPFHLQREGRTELGYFSYGLTPILDDGGHVVGVFVVIEETTTAVRAARQVAAFLDFALTNAGVAAWQLDEATGDVHRTREHARIFGYDAPPDKWTIPIFLDHVVPEDRDRVREAIEQCRATRGELNHEFRIIRHDGEIRWLWVMARHVNSSQGLRGALTGIAQDVTERKRTEKALRDSGARLEVERARVQAILDTIPVGLFVFDANGATTLMNDNATRIWGGAAPIQSFADYGAYKGFWPDTGERLRNDEWPAFTSMREGRKIEGFVVDIERFDGTRGTIVLSTAPIVDSRGTVTGGVSAIQDVSELREAQARLEEADRRKSEFLAVLSHELRNPLAPVKNSLFVLNRVGSGSEQAVRAREVIGRQIDLLSHLVDDLLDVTRIARGKVKLQLTRVELNELTRRTVEDHRIELESKGLEFGFRGAPGPVHILADPARMAQVISNLLSNAAKFTPSGGCVGIALTRDEEAGQAVLRVTDTGIGIGPDLLPRLFEPFMQADTSLDRSKGGLGLGLALVKGLVVQHGGTVAVRSEGLGRGAEFTVRLPLHVEAVNDAEASESARQPIRHRIVVIEDNADAAASMREVLELLGHAVSLASDGPSGVARVRTERPTVVLCDVGLPGMDGYAVARAIHADESLRGIHLIAVTGYALPEDLERAREAGFEAHLAKPPDLGKLEALLEALKTG